MSTHRIPSDHFDQLARGDGDMLGVLRAGQRSKRLLLLRELHSTAKSCVPRLAVAAGTADAFALLAEAQRRSPDAVDDLLLDPHIGAWIMRSLRGLLVDRDISPEDLGHLGAVAAVAATRARLSFEVTASVRDGGLMLPSLGLVVMPTGRRWCRIRSRDRDGIEVDSAGTTIAVSFSPVREQPNWVPLRRLTSGAGGVTIDLRLDDLDPFRGCSRLPITDRLDAAVVEGWQAQLDEAWPSLVQDDRTRAEAIATGLSVIVPLRATEERAELSATCHEAVGAMGMTPPGNPVTMALALVHEFQHNKLSALLDLVTLLEPSPETHVYSPWRADPRRLRGLLQGAYAYLGLAAFWALRSTRPSSSGQPDQALAHFELALARDQVGRGLRDLRASGRLTRPGIRFVDGMARRLADLDRPEVPVRPRDLARLASLDHERSWRLRNVRFDPGAIDEWAAAWLAGTNHQLPRSLEVSISDGGGRMPSAGRHALIREHLALAHSTPPVNTDATPADLLVLDGRFAEAAEMYRAQIARDPDDLSSWAGLALARDEMSTPEPRALIESPETVLALHRAVRHRIGTAPEVDDLALWIDLVSTERG